MSAVADVIGLGILLRWKDKASAHIKKAERTVNDLGESVDSVTVKTAKLETGFANLGKVGAGITAFGIAGAATFYGLTKAAGTFQDTLRDTMTMTGLTGQAFTTMERDLSGLSLTMSTRFGMSAAEINKSFYQVLSSGAEAGSKQFTALSESALMLAKVVGMEPAQAVESLSDALHSFEMDVTSAEKMADVFFKTSMLGATTVPQMADAMKEASKVAVELMIPLEDVAAVLTGFAGKGIKGAEAGTAFRMVLGKLAAPAKNAKDALNKLGVQVYDSTTKKMRPVLDILKDMQTGLARVTHEEREAALKAIAGEEAFAKLGGILASDLSILEGWSKELKTGGVIQVAFAQKSKTINFAFSAMKESLRNVAIVLGNELLPILTTAFRKIALLGGKLKDFMSAHPKLTKTVVIFGAIATAAALVVGPILTVVGIIGAMGGIPAILSMVSAGFASLGGAALALGGVISTAFWPVTAVAATVALLYFAFKNNFLGIRTIVVSAGKVVWSFFKGIMKGVKSALYPLVSAFGETWSALKTAFSPLIKAGKYIGKLLNVSVEGSKGMKTLSDTAKLLGKVVGFTLAVPIKMTATFITWLVKGFSALIVKGRELTDWLIGKLEPHFGKIKKVLLFLVSPIGAVVDNFSKIKEAAKSVMDWIISNWGTIAGIMLSPVNLISDGWYALKDGLIGMFTAVRDAVSNAFSSIKDTITGVLDNIWDKISWVIAKVPDALLPESLEKIKRETLSVSKLGNTPTPIVSGLAAPITHPAYQSAVIRPVPHKEPMIMPPLSFAGATAGNVDKSINIQPGAIVIHATKIDEATALKIDRELAKLMERRRERR